MAQEQQVEEKETDTSGLDLLSGTQKCAILMLLLGEDEAAASSSPSKSISIAHFWVPDKRSKPDVSVSFSSTCCSCAILLSL